MGSEVSASTVWERAAAGGGAGGSFRGHPRAGSELPGARGCGLRRRDEEHVEYPAATRETARRAQAGNPPKGPVTFVGLADEDADGLMGAVADHHLFNVVSRGPQSVPKAAPSWTAARVRTGPWAATSLRLPWHDRAGINQLVELQCF